MSLQDRAKAVAKNIEGKVEEAIGMSQETLLKRLLDKQNKLKQML